MHLCRECEALLWRRHESCPTCRAQSPAAGAVTELVRRAPRLDVLAVVLAASAPLALVAADEALRRLLVAS